MQDASSLLKRLDDTTLIERVADHLAAGKVVGWYQGRFEMGPRALGNRSILADPRRAEMRDILNDKIKARENFRPFAPAVPIERAAEFFEITQPDPFMTLAPRVRPEKRADIAAAVHVDGTGRIQTVERSANPRYWDLITAFGKRTGVPVLLNTSFNRKEPIVSSPRGGRGVFPRKQDGRARARQTTWSRPIRTPRITSLRFVGPHGAARISGAAQLVADAFRLRARAGGSRTS